MGAACCQHACCLSCNLLGCLAGHEPCTACTPEGCSASADLQVQAVVFHQLLHITRLPGTHAAPMSLVCTPMPCLPLLQV